MTGPPDSPQQVHPPTTNPFNLPKDSYTAYRLQHATAQHLHRTSRRCFIGPIPEGWLKSHRRDWYKHQLHIHYSSKSVAFNSSSQYGKHRRLSGLEGPSATALYGHSFPPPDDLDAEQGTQLDGQTEGREVLKDGQPKQQIPRTTSPDVLSTDEAQARNAGQEETDLQWSPVSASSGVQSPKGKATSRTKSGESFVTASEQPLNELSPEGSPSGLQDQRWEGVDEEPHPLRSTSQESTRLKPASTSDSMPPKTSSLSEVPGDATSTSRLIRDTENDLPANGNDKGQSEEPKGVLSRVKSRVQNKSEARENEDSATQLQRQRSSLRALVHFEIPEESRRAELQMKARAAQMSLQRASTKLRRSKARDGQIMKMERMLVRVDITSHELSDEFDENEIQKVEARTQEKWREYMVVCRQSTSDDAEYILQMYKSRVIPAVEKTQAPKRSKHQIILGRKVSKVNMFSSLDKTIVLWTPSKKGTTFYVMQAQSSSNAVEWYTFLRTILGWNRAEQIQVNVPDMSVSLMLQNPFEGLEASRDIIKAAEGDDEAIRRTMEEEQAVAGRIVQRCLLMMSKNPEWEEILKAWERERVGLCWKRYDRLEWIHGENERKMYGTIAMMKSHELELRPKHHYSTMVHAHGKNKALTEPPPVEGFLVRLTSQKGATKRLGKMFFKRLYYSSYNNFLVFSTPSNAFPPTPPKLPTSDNNRTPSSREIADSIPLIYAVDPYPLQDNEIAWLMEGNRETTEQRQQYDHSARDEADRKLNYLYNCQGYINLCNVSRVRPFQMGATPADDDLEDGSDVDFDASVRDTDDYDGTTRTIDDDRTFELVMNNGLVLRLQAYDQVTQKEWMKRLRALVNYWKRRTAADIQLLKSVRQQNLEDLKIDEEAEASVGQFARKWEVTQSNASPELYNMCGIACCRTIHMSGTLYRKPRRHATFSRCSIILCNGRLLVFQDTLRKHSGREVPSIHQERIASLDLKDCYLYSGLLTESELLYQNQTFDSNKPGHHALPRIYLEDGWTSTDEDVMTCFVVWHGKKKSWFRSETVDDDAGESRRSKLKLVSRLGVPGRSVVFRARSRAERDHWVLAIQNEIERLKQEEDFRIEGNTNT